MIPGMVGKNIGEWIKAGTLPNTVSTFGKDIAKLQLGAVGIYTGTQKIHTGLQQLMAGSRNYNLSTITRRDLMSLSEERARSPGFRR